MERIEVVDIKTGRVLRRFGLDGREGRIRLVAIRARLADIEAAHPNTQIMAKRVPIDDDERSLPDDAPTHIWSHR